jgi:hypothetical protein
MGRGIKFRSNIISRANPSLLFIRATINEELVPYHPEAKKIRFIPKRIKFLFLFLKYFDSTITPRIKDTITTESPRIPLSISKGVKLIKIHNITLI